jgi:alkyldihydroxyacetonephosphate synthase
VTGDRDRPPVHAVALDVDGTLAGADHRVSSRTSRVLAALQAAGVYPVVVTGRTRVAALAIARLAGLHAPVIACNGAVVTDPTSGEDLFTAYLGTDRVAQLLTFAAQTGLEAIVWTSSRMFAEHASDATALIEEINGEPVELLPLGQVDPSAVVKIMLAGSSEALDALAPTISAEMPMLMRSMPTFYETSSPGAAKWESLQLVLERLDVRPKECMGIADGDTDVEWLSWIGVPIAVANARPRVLAVAERHIGHHADEAVADFLEDWFDLAPAFRQTSATADDGIPVSNLVQAIDELRDRLGRQAVSTDDSDLEATSHDTWPLTTKWAMAGRHPNKADVLVRARRVTAIVPVLEIASRHEIPVTVRALGSSVTGQPLPVRGGIVLDLSGIPADFALKETNLVVTATASYNGGALEDELNARGYTLGHSPQSLYRSTIGGWLSTLATGQFSSLYGGIEDLVVGYTVILATGETVDLSASPRAAMGPDLRQLFIGSEGTLGVITSVTLKVFPLPPAQLVQTSVMPNVAAGLAFMREQASLGLRPFLLRFYDTEEARHAMADPAFDSPVLFVGSRGVPEMAETELQVLTQLVLKHGGREIGPEGTLQWLNRRFDWSSVEETLAMPGGYAETIEVAHTWDKIDGLHAALKEALAPYANEVLGHFSHVYTQGTSLYMILYGQVDTDSEAIERLQQIWRVAMDVCLEHGSELSHHHGGGLARSPYTRRSLGSAHLILRKLKSALDPAGILNPGKLGL